MPTRGADEPRDKFLTRCMSDSKMVDEFGNTKQRYAVCVSYADKSSSASQTNMEFCDSCASEANCAEMGQCAADDATAKHGGQHGRPGSNDPRKTPAKPSERRKGSKRNPPGSAKGKGGKITFSKQTESTLREMVTKHNAKNERKVTLRMLKAVYRRGAGAFSTSHAPNMSRGGWAFARVRAFLYLVRRGRPSNPNYKQDNDLLPKSHPRANDMEMYQDWGVTVKSKMEDYIFMSRMEAVKKSREIGFKGKTHSTKTADGQTMYFPGANEKEFLEWYRKNDSDAEQELSAAEYQGRSVTLNKPFRTPNQRKKFGVYVRNSAGRVVIVRFGDPNMEIKRDDPKRRKAFRDRHNCSTATDKTTPRYWSCRQWRGGSRVEADHEEDHEEEEY